MRFKFCGDNDVPDWLLGQVNSISKLTDLKLKPLLQNIVENIIAGEVDYEKIKKLTADATYSDTELKACVSALTFILSNSVKFCVDASHLKNELQQIGFSLQHASSITECYTNSSTVLTQHFINSILKINSVVAIKCSRLNPSYVKLTLTTSNGSSKSREMSNGLSGANQGNSSADSNGVDSHTQLTNHTLVLTEKHYSLLLKELIDVQRRIEEMSES